MRQFLFMLMVFTAGYWTNYFARSINLGFALTIVAFAIPTLLYYISVIKQSNDERKHKKAI